jgi:hypothetical protein
MIRGVRLLLHLLKGRKDQIDPYGPTRLIWFFSQPPKLPELVGWPDVRESLGSEGFSNVLLSTLCGASATPSEAKSSH